VAVRPGVGVVLVIAVAREARTPPRGGAASVRTRLEAALRPLESSVGPLGLLLTCHPGCMHRFLPFEDSRSSNLVYKMSIGMYAGYSSVSLVYIPSHSGAAVTAARPWVDLLPLGATWDLGRRRLTR